MIPEHNFGLMHYGSVTVSPTDWISARVGIVGLDADTIGESSRLNPIINASIPLEIRSDKLFLKFNLNIHTIQKPVQRQDQLHYKAVSEKNRIGF